MPKAPNIEPADASDDVPRISIAGKTWPIPLFAPMQNRVIVPRILKLGGAKMTAMTEEQYDNFIEIVFMALSALHPTLKRVDFLDWAIPTPEFFLALPVITAQTGVFTMNSDAPKGDASGEANGSLQTGTV